MPTKKLNIIVNQKGAKQATAQQQRLGSSIAKTIGQYVAAGVAIRKVGTFLTSSIKLYGVQEQAEKQLATAIGHTSKALLEQAAALQRQTTYGDEEIIQAQALIGAFVKEESQIKLATKATLDLAAAKGMDLKTAADLVAKSLGSSTNALSRYGIEVKGAVGSTERLKSLFDSIQGKFGGQAAAAADTLAGRMTQLSNAWGDLKENVGGWMEKQFQLTEFFKVLTEAIQGELKHHRSITEVIASHVYKINQLKAGMREIKAEYEELTPQQQLNIAAMQRQIKHEQIIIKALQRRKAELDKTNEAQQKEKDILSEQEAYTAYVKKIESEAAAREQALRFQQRYITQLARENKLHLEAAKPDVDLDQRMPTGMEQIFKFDEATGKWITTLGKAKQELKEISTIPVSKQVEITNTGYQQQIGYLDNIQAGANAFFTIWSMGSEKQKKETKAWALLAAYVNTAAGITKAFAEYGWPKGIYPAAMIAASGAVQIASIQGREKGGVIEKGKPYIVGEAGQEVIIPNETSYVVPNNQLGGITINFNGNITDRRYVQTFLIPEIKKAVQLGRG